VTGRVFAPQPSCSTRRWRSGNGESRRNATGGRPGRPRARRAEVARRERLAALAAEGDGAWARVAARIAEKTPSGYDIAVNLLVDLQEVCDSAVLASRVESLRREHGRKVTFIQRLSNVGL
jgi:hypothetical protein